VSYGSIMLSTFQYVVWHCVGIRPLSLLIMMSSLGIILYIKWLITFWYSFCYHNDFWCGAFLLLFILFCTSIYLSNSWNEVSVVWILVLFTS